MYRNLSFLKCNYHNAVIESTYVLLELKSYNYRSIDIRKITKPLKKSVIDFRINDEKEDNKKRLT